MMEKDVNVLNEFAKAYPVIAKAIAEGIASPNEIWLKHIWLEAFMKGVAFEHAAQETENGAYQ